MTALVSLVAIIVSWGNIKTREAGELSPFLDKHFQVEIKSESYP